MNLDSHKKERRKIITELNERIGIDRSVLYNFEVEIPSINVQKIESQAKKRKNSTKSYIRIVYDDNSPLQLLDGKRIGKLEIKDTDIGKLTISFYKNNLHGSKCSQSTLELMPKLAKCFECWRILTVL